MENIAEDDIVVEMGRRMGVVELGWGYIWGLGEAVRNGATYAMDDPELIREWIVTNGAIDMNPADVVQVDINDD